MTELAKKITIICTNIVKYEILENEQEANKWRELYAGYFSSAEYLINFRNRWYDKIENMLHEKQVTR